MVNGVSHVEKEEVDGGVADLYEHLLKEEARSQVQAPHHAKRSPVISEFKAPSNNELKALNSISGVAPTLLNKNRSAVVTLTPVDNNQPS
ncbi:hypothetical protein H5410_052077 [Solanum commersonii]|uniref:Uncharacterized protein n=1 Tax=Solanum commersonii TaxID=4109 RepID=A0A9J5X0D8_SOLCO|nr:hypothetical protein H5410_052077 [Solanum commersonii]